MEHDAALRLLESADTHARLGAARYLANHSDQADLEHLRKALNRESVIWIKTALRAAIDRIYDGADVANADAEQEMQPAAIRSAELFNTATGVLLHEISPIVGALALGAVSEVPDYADSQTAFHIKRLQSFIEGMNRLRRASTAPVIDTFDLAPVIKGLNAEHGLPKLDINAVGPSPMLVRADRSLIEMVIRNALRNAVEAISVSLANQTPQIVVTWGETDRDWWLTVLDNGLGLPFGSNRAFDIGATTKSGHLGLGLAIARQAAQSMNGSVSLTSRPDASGAAFEFRWPKQ